MLWAMRLLARVIGSIWELASRLGRARDGADPAEELRRRLAESGERETAPAVDTTVGPPSGVLGESKPASTDVEALRDEVRARARAVTEEMRGAGGGGSDGDSVEC
jgi:hypothetical protein